MKNYIFYLLTLITLSTLQFPTVQAENTNTKTAIAPQAEIVQAKIAEKDNNATGIVLFVVILQMFIIGLFYKIKAELNYSNAKLSSVQTLEDSFTPKENKKDWGEMVFIPKPIYNLQHI